MAKYLKYVSTDYSYHGYKPVLLRALKHSPFLRLLVADWMSLFYFFCRRRKHRVSSTRRRRFKKNEIN